MYVVAIAWIYVAVMVSITQPSVFRGIVMFVGTGLLPLALVLWLAGTPQRRRDRARAEALAADRARAETLAARESSVQPPKDSGTPDH